MHLLSSIGDSQWSFLIAGIHFAGAKMVHQLLPLPQFKLFTLKYFCVKHFDNVEIIFIQQFFFKKQF